MYTGRSLCLIIHAVNDDVHGVLQARLKSSSVPCLCSITCEPAPSPTTSAAASGATSATPVEDVVLPVRKDVTLTYYFVTVRGLFCIRQLRVSVFGLWL